MAALYARAFPDGRAWSAAEISALCRPPGFAIATAAGFALGRVVADEAELLTIAVAPEARRVGAGRLLLGRFDAASMDLGACRAFLEVATDNSPAIGLYESEDWKRISIRKKYYKRPLQGAVDAYIYEKKLGLPQDSAFSPKKG